MQESFDFRFPLAWGGSAPLSRFLRKKRDHPLTQLPDGRVIRQRLRLPGNIVRKPARKRLDIQSMSAWRGVHFANARDAGLGQGARDPHERHPQTSMDVSDVAVHEASDEDL